MIERKAGSEQGYKQDAILDNENTEHICTALASFDREIRCGHRNGIFVVVVVLKIPLSKIMVLHYFCGIRLFLWY